MCVPLAAAAVAISAVSAISSAQGQAQAAEAQAGQQRVAGQSAISSAAMNTALADQEAKDTTLAAASEADNIKRQAMLTRGQIAVAQSGSGVMIGEGSAQAAMDQLDTLSSADALATIYSGINGAVSKRAAGRFGLTSGQNQLAAANSAASSLDTSAGYSRLSGLGAAAGGLAQLAGSSSTPKTTGTTSGG